MMILSVLWKYSKIYLFYSVGECHKLLKYFTLKNEEHVYIKIKPYISFVDSNACMEQKTNQRQSELPAGTDFGQNSTPHRVLKTPARPTRSRFFTHVLLFCPWPWFTLTQCLFSIGYDLHPHIASFPVITLLILFLDRCICQQYPPGSLQVKAIYHMTWKRTQLFMAA